MNKFLLFGTIIFMLLIITYFVDVTYLYETTTDLGGTFEKPSSFGLINVWKMAKTFFKILTFQITGMPFIINVFIYTLSSIVLYMILDFARS